MPTRVATPETEEAWLDAAQDRNLRQIEDLVAGQRAGTRVQTGGGDEDEGRCLDVRAMQFGEVIDFFGDRR